VPGSIIAHYYSKSNIHNHYIVELNIWQIRGNKKFPDNIKYNLICIDTKSGNKILFDNHVPKSNHYHINDNEYKYEFISEKKLIVDFKQLVLDKLGIII